MKLKNHQISAFLDKEWQNYPIIVLFGHSFDIISHRQRQILEKFRVNTRDAFTFTRLEGAQVSLDPSLLMREICNINLMLQTRTILLKGTSIELSKTLISLCQHEMLTYLNANRLLVIIQDLSKKSILMQHLNQCTWVAIIPCYDADHKDFITILKNFCNKQNQQINKDAESQLWKIAQNNWDNLRQTLEKLSFYCEDKFTIDYKDIIDCSDETQNYHLLNFVLTVFSEQSQEADQQLSGLLQQKISDIIIIRQLMQHCVRLLRIQSHAKFNDLNTAIKKYQPLINIKDRTAILLQCQRFSPQKIQQCLADLLNFEIQYRSMKKYSQLQLRYWIINLHSDYCIKQ